jgi:hypothetical protein
MQVRQNDAQRLLWARMGAASHEAGIPAVRRKRLGQFFTGLPLARLLAAISVREPCRKVIDPMAGSGDLLDAVVERSRRIGLNLERIDSIEICEATAEVCRARLAAWQDAAPEIACHIHVGSAFDPKTLGRLELGSYDLVITNPPYVRYQSTSKDADGAAPEAVRAALLGAADGVSFKREAHVWRAVVESYSGLSDLSVPAWLLAAMLVKPGGKLALVAPATWRSRDYADVLLYVLARFFRLDVVVADRQRGWFSSALVRTQLVMATRLPPEETEMPMAQRDCRPENCQWIELGPEAQGGESLVGSAFSSDDPERDFADWVLTGADAAGSRKGIRREARKHADETADVLARCGRSGWLPRVEPLAGDLPLFRGAMQGTDGLLPQDLATVLDFRPRRVCRLETLGIKVGQGLRTGCNDFFYVDFVDNRQDGYACVRPGKLYRCGSLAVPVDTLVPVLRRQSELDLYAQGVLPPGRILNLRRYVLPEDREAVETARDLYERLREPLPSIMPEELAEHVRRVAATRVGGEPQAGRIPELTAVRTNARPARYGNRPVTPRFWYMLPELARRHCPDAFVPRVNQLTPQTVMNRGEPIAIDANFATLWSDDPRWTPDAICALLRSTWARACMEAVGTPMGGGALKLEATQIRRLPMPELDDCEIARLRLLDVKCPTDAIDGVVIGALMRQSEGRVAADRVGLTRHQLESFIEDAQLARQRK